MNQNLTDVTGTTDEYRVKVQPSADGTCPDCKGRGSYSGFLSSESCRLCSGTGRVEPGTKPTALCVDLRPQKIVVNAGTVSIEADEVGMGHLFIDGKEIIGVVAATIKVRVSEATTVEIEMYPLRS